MDRTIIVSMTPVDGAGFPAARLGTSMATARLGAR